MFDQLFTALFEYQFFINALIGVLLISAAAAMIGTYIVTRRLVAISGGVTHACFGGLGLGCFLGVNPMLTAGIFAVASALGVEWLSDRHKVREDSAIAVVWAVGMAVGVVFLFGNILTISTTDLWIFAAYLALLSLFFVWKYRQIVACAFDADFARVSHLPVRVVNTAMTVAVALCIVLTIRLVGIMLLMSLISLPQLTAEVFARRFSGMMALSVAVSVVCCLAGLFLATVIDVPCSALIVMVMAAVFAVARMLRRLGMRH